MDREILRQVLELGESQNVEFMADIQPDTSGRVICSFLNSKGGYLVIGVSDKDTIVGIPAGHDIRELEISISSRLVPKALVSFEERILDDKTVWRVEVPAGQDKPYSIGGGTFVRDGAHIKRADVTTNKDMILRRNIGAERWERRFSNADLEKDLDHEEIWSTAKDALEKRHADFGFAQRDSPIEFLEKMGLVKYGRLTNGGDVLFAGHPAKRHPQVRVRAVCYTHDKTDETFLDYKNFEGPLSRILDQTYAFIQRNAATRSYFLNTSLSRNDQSVYPFLAVREALINALAHRDYADFGGGITVSMYPDRVEIWNSGNLPDEITADELGKRDVVSRLRNPDIAYILYLRGWMERLGCGCVKICKDCEKQGLRPPVWRSDPLEGVTLTLFAPEAARQITKENNPAVTAIFPDVYRQWLIESYQHLDADKLCGSEMVALNLPEIFTPLYSLGTDLEELIARQDILLVEGHPGSGKTTLLKHVTYCLAKEGAPCVPLTPLAEFLPILIFFKDLHDYFRDQTAVEVVALDIIEWCCRNRMGATIDAATVRAFIEQRRALILLDGLDELPQPHRDSVVTRFADLRVSHPGVRLVITGRPHGIDGVAFKRFDRERVAINTLTMEQVETFVTKWFRYFYPGDSGPGGRTAAGLISEVKTHPAVGALIDNPLMLTAICILYHDQKELPGQRAELYKRFVDNMLYRRFGPDFEEVLAFLKTLAHTLHTQKIKIIDEIGALEKMRLSFRQREQEDAPEYEARIRKRFGEIEAQSGLLKLDAGGYEFRHLTFQEFLCADYLSDTATDYHAAIAPFWDDDWHREMIELYISYISIRNKGMANAIVARALEQEDQGRWLKAAAALNDIQKNRRDPNVVATARVALLRIFHAEERVDRKVLAKAGELLGWLGDPRALKEFVPIAGGEYDLEELGRRSIAPFELGKYPVTNGWFREFVDAGGYAARECWSEEGWQWKLDATVDYPELWYDRKWCCPNAPVVGVSWWEAEAFCRWLTMTDGDGRVYRLPMEAEWQTAAAGHERRTYAWGNDEEWFRCNCGEGDDRIGGTSAVGIFEQGKSPEGIYDLSGNVWEWCEDVIDDSNRLLRGGGWDSEAWDCRLASRYGRTPGFRIGDIGFRLARRKQE